MDYELELRGRTYELPKFTRSVKNKMEKINSDNASNLSDVKKFKNMYVFIKESVGEEAAKEIFGTDNFDDMDLNDITVCYIEIANAYDKPVNEAKKANIDLNDDDRELVMALLKNAGSLNNLEKILKNAGGKKTPIRRL